MDPQTVFETRLTAHALVANAGNFNTTRLAARTGIQRIIGLALFLVTGARNRLAHAQSPTRSVLAVRCGRNIAQSGFT